MNLIIQKLKLAQNQIHHINNHGQPGQVSTKDLMAVVTNKELMVQFIKEAQNLQDLLEDMIDVTYTLKDGLKT